MNAINEIELTNSPNKGMIMSEFIYRPANEIKPGDILPDASTSPVSRVIIFPNEAILITFRGTSFTKRFYHGGPDYGWPGVSIERAP